MTKPVALRRRTAPEPAGAIKTTPDPRPGAQATEARLAIQSPVRSASTSRGSLGEARSVLNRNETHSRRTTGCST